METDQKSTLESDIQAFKDHFHCTEYTYNRKPGLLLMRIERFIGEPARNEIFSNLRSWITDDYQVIETFSSRRSVYDITHYEPFMKFEYEEMKRGNRVVVYAASEFNVFFEDCHELEKIREDFYIDRGNYYSTIVILIKKR